MQPTRIAVFYDGSYFKAGNIFFKYKEKRGWFSLPALHTFLVRYISQKEKVPVELTKVVQAHYYDGRMSTDAALTDQLEKDRDFELALIDAGIVPHFLPVRETQKDANNPAAGYSLSQKGVDVNIALDCLDIAFSDRYDVAVLIAGDEDFVPLVRKVTAMGKRVLVAYFDIETWKDDTGKQRRATFCSRKLQDAASYLLNFNQIVEDRDWKTDVKALFF